MSVRSLAWRSWLTGALWLAACLAALYVAMQYDYRPGRLGTPQTGWPEGSALPHQPGRLTVVAFLHPRCVCSRATVNQLVRAVTAHPAGDLIVPVFAPAHATEAA